eukprot:TRINITY_DN1646_c0_g1_i1.p1 TRINITY_DN1646_c0_g1~~TRINITY_DN1646_c0_g1_i1.p1  ORF type:complete len:194 (-),score=34.59 TRINITY_DN1646_c0_g1_i1:28-609(-)
MYWRIDQTDNPAKGYIDLDHVLLVNVREDNYGFPVDQRFGFEVWTEQPDRVYDLMTATEQERDDWIAFFSEQVQDRIKNDNYMYNEANLEIEWPLMEVKDDNLGWETITYSNLFIVEKAMVGPLLYRKLEYRVVANLSNGKFKLFSTHQYPDALKAFYTIVQKRILEVLVLSAVTPDEYYEVISEYIRNLVVE